MLSACADPAPRRSPSNAQASSVSSGSFALNSASTATTAATALAALPPRPLESGRPFLIVSVTPRSPPIRSSSACAATPAVFFAASRGSRPSSPTMPSMHTPSAPGRAVTSSPGASSAKPSTSNPHATLDTVAGANAVTGSTATSSYFGGAGGRAKAISAFASSCPRVFVVSWISWLRDQRRYRSRMVGIRYSRKARSKSYCGAKLQSARAAESSTSAGHESTIP